VKALAKKLARALLGEYSAYYVYARAADGRVLAPSATTPTFRMAQVDVSTLTASHDALIREQADYAGQETRAYACFVDDRIVGVCFYWFGRRYLQRNFWPLADGEAKLVQILALPDMRGRGVATQLIEWSWRDMTQQGFHKTYARIWHSNTPSLRAFERAGWARVALVLEINPLKRSRPIRLRFGAKPAGKFE
jgi:GNAT superfamily N-acetyltransferase